MPCSPEHLQRRDEQMDRFAELLSLDLSTAQIAERMGIRRTRASQMLGELRRKYGWQAA